jgi:GNAT superfamily N-acetyltransferase
MSREICIRPVTTRADWRRFLDFPYRLYRDAPYWVAPLRIEQKLTLSPRGNPFWQHARREAFLALDQQGRVLGRIAAIVNGQHLLKYQDATGFFGFFETVDDYPVAQGLLDAAGHWLRAQGMRAVRGPANPSLNDVSGLLVRGFEREPAVFMPYNFPYYEAFLERYGYERVMTTYAYYLHRRYSDFEKLRPWLRELEQHYPNLCLRCGDRRHFDRELATIMSLYNEGFSGNWGHVPMTEAEFRQLGQLFKHFLKPELALFLESDGEPIGFVVALEDLNEVLRFQRDGRLLPFAWLRLWLRWKLGGVKTVRAALGGVRRQYQGHGLAALLGLWAVERNWLSGYDGVELGWILQTNKLFIDGLDRIGAARDKEYALFERSLV